MSGPNARWALPQDERPPLDQMAVASHVPVTPDVAAPPSKLAPGLAMELLAIGGNIIEAQREIIAIATAYEIAVGDFERGELPMRAAAATLSRMADALAARAHHIERTIDRLPRVRRGSES